MTEYFILTVVFFGLGDSKRVSAGDEQIIPVQEEKDEKSQKAVKGVFGWLG